MFDAECINYTGRQCSVVTQTTVLLFPVNIALTTDNIYIIIGVFF